MSATTCAWLTDRPLGTLKLGRRWTVRGRGAAGLGRYVLGRIGSLTRSIIGRMVTLVRRSTSPMDERTREAEGATPCEGAVVSTAVAGPATIIRQPRTRPRARLGKCNVVHSCLRSGSRRLPRAGACGRPDPWRPPGDAPLEDIRRLSRGRPYHTGYLSLQLAQTAQPRLTSRRRPRARRL